MKKLLSGPFHIRWKITMAALAPLAFTLLLVWAAALYFINGWIVDEAQKAIRHDLNAAREVLKNVQDRVRSVVRFTANTYALGEALESGEVERVREELQAIRRREGLDILTVTDPRGRVILRSAALSSAAGDRAPWPFEKLAHQGTPFFGPVLLSREELRREGEALEARARVPSRSPDAEAGEGETGGMFLACGKPVTGSDGRVLGYLYGGLLLNRNLDLVDHIKEIVYGDETFQGVEIGSATIFLNDLRVATTIRLRDGKRALGTRVSREVAEAVLERKQMWLDRARVVNDWYLTAYEPLLGPDGEAIGILYVGQLEKPFNQLKVRAALVLLGLLLLGGFLGSLIARYLSKRLSRPILELESTARQVAGGERDILLPVTTRDEIGDLTATFNRMTAALKAQEEALQQLNRELEEKVRERTAQLEEKSWQLIRTREELGRKEKLAALGSLASGVAHEINNPAAVIRGNVEILMADLAADDPRREEATEILKQTERISLITQNMLAFARQQVVAQEQVQVNRILCDVLAQIRHQAPMEGISVCREFEPALPPVLGDGERLRQVFNNLILNAVQAMEGEGVLTVRTLRENGRVLVEVADTGPGIPLAAREKIFHPFYTTKRGGTGLGLSVSYGIVQALGGSIEVEQNEEAGVTFQVRLVAGEGR